MTRLPNKSQLLRQTNETKHEIAVDPDDPEVVMEVWVRDISFFDVQKSAQEMLSIGSDGGMNLDLEAYWKHAFTHWIVRTNPELTPAELLQLKGAIGQRIAAILPSPEQVGQMLQGDFTNGGGR